VPSRAADLLLQAGLGILGLRARPAIPDGMPLLTDDDLVFVEQGGTRATV
jgi:hypothetical protein